MANNGFECAYIKSKLGWM